MTITGTFLDANDEPRAGVVVRFIPEDCPQADGLGVITAPSIPVTLDDEGTMGDGVELEQGRYLVQVGILKRDVFQILVLDSGATVDITTLITTEPVIPSSILQQGVNFRVKNGILQLKNLDTGKYHRLDAVGPEDAATTQLGVSEA